MKYHNDDWKFRPTFSTIAIGNLKLEISHYLKISQQETFSTIFVISTFAKMSLFFVEHSKENASNLLSFSPLSDQDGLPFPLYLHPAWKVVLAISILLTLIEGTRLRLIIIDYLKSPERKLGPINYLIWVDQINSFFFGINAVFRIVFFLSPEPIGILLGSQFCDISHLIAVVSLAGSYTWGCYIALFRVLFIKCQNWLTNTIGIKNMLCTMLCIGTTQIFSFAAIFFYIDEESFVRKICFHLSLNDLTIKQDFQVMHISVRF